MNALTHKRAIQGLVSGLLASLLCISNISLAQTSEVEANDDAASAQVLSLAAGTETVSGALGTDTDIDIYAFDAQAGDPVDIMSISGNCLGGVDPVIALYDENGNLLRQEDDEFADPGAGQNFCDARLHGAALLTTGRYYVAISGSPQSFGDSFTRMFSLPAATGTYQLVISGVTSAPVGGGDAPPPDPDPLPLPDDDDASEPTKISMEVLHWRGRDRDVSKRWKKRIKRMGKRNGIAPIPVVMFSSQTFDATNINTKSLTFGATGEEDSLFRCSRRPRDVNRDGMDDMVCYFDAYKTGFEVNVVEGLLNGETMDGEAFESAATLKVFKVTPKKRKAWKKRHHRKHAKHHKRHKHHKHHKRHKHHSAHNN